MSEMAMFQQLWQTVRVFPDAQSNKREGNGGYGDGANQ
jgi:hypothetical protein